MAYTGSKAQAGRGTVLSIGELTGTTTTTWTPIGEISSSGISGSQWQTDDVSNFDSGADQEFITTMRDNGTVDISGNRVPLDAGQAAIEAAFADGLKYDFKIQLPKNVQAGQTTSGDSYTFSAIVLSREVPIETTRKVGWNVKLKISGAVTLMPGS